jgi:hypothetical protein
MIMILTWIAFLFDTTAYLAEQETNGDILYSIPKATYCSVIFILIDMEICI